MRQFSNPTHPRIDEFSRAYRFSPENVGIALGKHRGRYRKLSVKVRTITPCSTEWDALYQSTVLRRMKKNGTCRLQADILRRVIGGGSDEYLAVQRRNLAVVSPRMRRIKRAGEVVEVKDYRPSHLSSTGQGRATTYRVAKKYRNVREGKRPAYILRGAAAARFIRALWDAFCIGLDRHDRWVRHFQAQAAKVTLDVQGAEAAGFSRREISEALGKLKSRKATVEATGRVHLALTNIPADWRPFYRLDGQRLTSVDLVCAHPSLLVLYATREWNLPLAEVDGLRELVTSGSIKSVIPNIVKWLNASRGDKAFPEVEAYFRSRFPEFHRCFCRLRDEQRDSICRIYSKLETEIMNSVLEALSSRGLLEYVVTREHDGLRVVENQAENILGVVSEVLASLGDGLLRAKIKSPESEARSLRSRRELVINEKVEPGAGVYAELTSLPQKPRQNEGSHRNLRLVPAVHSSPVPGADSVQSKTMPQTPPRPPKRPPEPRKPPTHFLVSVPEDYDPNDLSVLSDEIERLTLGQGALGIVSQALTLGKTRREIRQALRAAHRSRVPVHRRPAYLASVLRVEREDEEPRARAAS